MDRRAIGVAIGLDVGTSGVRAVAVATDGGVLADSRMDFEDARQTGTTHEQDCNDWWSATCQVIKVVLGELRSKENSTDLGGVAVTSTSGSLVLTGREGQPVRPAILYDDVRGSTIAEEVNRRDSRDSAPFNSSYSFIKAAWVKSEEPSVWDRASHLLPPASWLEGKLTGQFGTTDYSNALKLGYDFEKGEWSPAALSIGIPSYMLPKVVRPGQRIGSVSARASEETGLAIGTPVVAGTTDGMASFIASGANRVGHANTTLGTTIVWKVLSDVKPRLGSGMYCHPFASNRWAPGAASNTGPGSLQIDALRVASPQTDGLATSHLPSGIICYLLQSRGERFPFLNPEAQEFIEGSPSCPSEWHAAQLQSLAFVERWGYERLEECRVPRGSEVFSTGKAAASPVFSQLRANVLNRVVMCSQHPTASFGAAILAASDTFYGGDLDAAICGMTRVSEDYKPDHEISQRFEEFYLRFRVACSRRGYV